MFLDSIELNNFKSYAGTHLIGPFMPFTSIIGPNGSGKSNLMEAICFVLGVSAHHLRSNNLEDLVCHLSLEDAKIPADNKALTSVKANFKSEYTPRNETHQPTHQPAQQQTITFERVIGANNTSSEYHYNGMRVSQAEYLKRLEDLNILAKAKNFLIFQGDVETLVSKSNREKADLLELVSGSQIYKEEMETLMKEHKELDQERKEKERLWSTLRHNKKRVDDQCKGMEQANELQKILDAVKLDWDLFRFHAIDKQFDRQIDLLSGTAKDLNKHLHHLESMEKENKEIRIEHAKASKHRDQVNIAYKKVCAERDAIHPEQLILRERLDISAKRIKDLHDKLLYDEKVTSDLQNSIQAHEQDLSQAIRTLNALRDKDQDATQPGKGLGMATPNRSKEKLEEYKQIKLQADAQCMRMTQNLSDLRQKWAGFESDLKREQASLAARQEEQNSLNQILHTLQQRKNKLEAYIATMSKNHADCESKGKDLQRTAVEAQRESQMLTQKLDAATAGLKAFKADKQERALETVYDTAVKRLIEQFPKSVHGKLFGLCQVRDQRYMAAISVVLGRNMDSVVVEDDKTAYQCISFLKKEKIPVTLVFLPLNSVKQPMIQESLRALGGTSRLAVDLIHYDKSHRAVVEYACGNTVVCDTFEEAQRIRSQQPSKKIKCVTRDGTLIRKNGVLTGGLHALSHRTIKWSAKQVEQLKKDKEFYLNRLNELAMVNYSERIKDIDQELMGYTQKIRIAQEDFNMTAKRHSETSLKLDANMLGSEQSQERIKGLRLAMNNINQSEEQCKKEKDLIYQQVFQTFCESLGIQSIKGYEQSSVADEEDRQNKMLHLTQVVSKLTSQIALLKSRLREDLVASHRAAIVQEEHKIKETETKLALLTGSLHTLEARVKELDVEKTKADRLIQEKDALLKEARKKSMQSKQERDQLLSRANGILSKMDMLRSKRAGLVLWGNIELENLPLMGDTQIDTEVLISNRNKSLLNHVSELRVREEEMGDGEANLLSQSTLLANTKVSIDDRLVSDLRQHRFFDHFTFDYAKLKRKLAAVVDEDQVESLNQQFEERIRELSASIDKNAPDRGAVESFEFITRGFKEMSEAFQKITDRWLEVADKLEKAKEKRKAHFKKAFSHVEKAVQEIYKELTYDPKTGMSGFAQLDLDNENDLFGANGGIKYTVLPSNKGVVQMNDLSGGEKTMAAIAFLFALQSYKMAPFFVLDEIDAALDKENVDRVASYIYKRTHSASGPFQAIVISLKESFYSTSDALAGIYKDHSMHTSGCITLDLTEYEMV